MEQLRNVQLKQLEIFKEFHRICTEHSLRYFAIGGTCIGAIRHKGFIPWDDDIDVVMPYEDFQKLRLLRQKFCKQFEVLDFDNSLYHAFLFLKIHDNTTTFIEESIKKYPDRYIGCSIDIMPIYGISTNNIIQTFSIKKYQLYRRLNNSQRLPFKERRTPLLKLLWILNIPIRWIKPFNFYSRKIEKMLSRWEFGTTDKIMFGWRWENKRIVFDYQDFSDYIEMPFEDTTIRVPIGYDNYLKKDFGDYMKLPPEEQRISGHPAAVIDLERSYREYAKEGIST